MRDLLYVYREKSTPVNPTAPMIQPSLLCIHSMQNITYVIS